MWYTAANNTSLLTKHFKIFYSSSAVTPLKHLTPVITRVLHQTLNSDLMPNPSSYGAIKENVVPNLPPTPRLIFSGPCCFNNPKAFNPSHPNLSGQDKKISNMLHYDKFIPILK